MTNFISRIVTPAPILENPLFTWKLLSSSQDTGHIIVVDETSKSLSNVPWAAYPTAVNLVRKLFDNSMISYTTKDLTWYKTDNVKLESNIYDKNGNDLQDCLKKIFSPFMWIKLQEKLSNQILLLLCRDNAEPTSADIIMNMAIQMDRLKPWQIQYRGNITIINGQDKNI